MLTRQLGPSTRVVETGLKGKEGPCAVITTDAASDNSRHPYASHGGVVKDISIHRPIWMGLIHTVSLASFQYIGGATIAGSHGSLKSVRC